MSIFKKAYNRQTRHSFLLKVILAVCYQGTPGSAFAQIIPDATLPNNTIVTPSGNTLTIEGGTTASSNLFHSFTEFGVPTGSEAFFNNATTIDNIITRVTGGKISNIDGLMRANGSANLFLINPNGIVFGPNARLDIGGSFFGSTAESILFENNLEYSATNPNTPPLLTVNVPLGLQYGPSVRPIVNQSTAGLEVPPGNTLAIIGGNVSLQGGDMKAASGRIELGSVGDNSLVSIAETDKGFALGYDEVNNFSNVELSGGATVDVSGAPSGKLQLHGRTLTISSDAKIISINSGLEGGGEIKINGTERVEIIGTGSSLQTSADIIDGGVAENDNLSSGLFSSTVGKGAGGNIRIDTGQLMGTESASIYTIAEGEGRGGDLIINASDSVELTGLSLLISNTSSAGDGGNAIVNTDRLLLQEAGSVSSLNLGTGRSGNIIINASDSIELVGTNQEVIQRSNGNFLISVTFLLSSSEFGGPGNVGDMYLSTGRLIVRNGAGLQVASNGRGRSGNLLVRATESVELSGATPDEFATPSLIAVGALNPSAENAGGNTRIITRNLIIRDNATIFMRNASPGSGGNIEVVADKLLMDSGARIEAETAFGKGGNIVLRTQDLRLHDNSEISVTGGSAEFLFGLPPELAALFPIATGVGDGGNITIETDTLVALENSDITANAQQGFGGRVTIAALGIFGTQVRSQLTPESDITATSELGASFSGVVEIRIEDVDRARGIVKLPESPLDISSLVGKDFCSVVAQTDSSFVITGRGGIARNPGDILPGMTTRVNLVDPVFTQETRSRREPVARENTRSHVEENTRSGEIVEAQGWYVNAEGVVVLTANPTVINAPSSGLVHPQCHLPGDSSLR